MGYVNQSVISANDQENGQRADITKLEAVVAELARANDDTYGQLLGLINMDKFSQLGIANIKDKAFGAIANGTPSQFGTDNRQAFLNALSYLKSVGGGILYIPPSSGIYDVYNHIEIDESYGHITIMGGGRNSHIRLAQKSTNGHLIGIAGTGRDLGATTDETKWVQSATVKDLQLSTYNGTSSQDDNPLGISWAKNVIVENVWVPFSNWKGVTCQRYSKNITLRNVHTENCKKSGITIEFSTVSNVVIENCRSNNNTEHGMLITAAGDGGFITGVRVNGFRGTQNTKCGLSFSGVEKAQVNLVEVANNGEFGIQLFNSKGCSVRGKSGNNGYAGVRIQNDASGTYAGGGNALEVESYSNSLSDPNSRGNFFVENSPRTRFINCDGRVGVRAISHWSEYSTFVGCDFEGATMANSETTAATKLSVGSRGI